MIANRPVRNKIHVQFQHVKTNILESRQRRIAAAKIVHFHFIIQSMKLVHGIHDDLRPMDNHRFRNFDMNKIRRDFVFLANFFQPLDKIRFYHIATRKIHRDPNDRQIFVQHFPQKTADLFKHIGVQFRNTPIFFQDRNKIQRRNDAVFWRNPADQGFRTDKAARRMAELRLVINSKLSRF